MGEMPSLGNDGTAAEDPGGVRYVMAPTVLTRFDDSVVAAVKETEE